MWPLILLVGAAWAKSRADAAQAARMGDGTPLDQVMRSRVAPAINVPQVPWGKATMAPGVGNPSIAVPVVARNRAIPGSATQLKTMNPTLLPIPPLSDLMEFDVMVARPDPAAAIPIQTHPHPE